MEFRILGPLEVVGARDGVPLDAPKLRALLAVLLLHPNEVVSSERLIDELWGARPPATAAKVVQNYVSQLRRGLGPELIETRTPGYRLRLDEHALDAARFRRLVVDARGLVTSGEHARAQAAYGDALALWRGPPLEDVRFESSARNEVDWLEEERLRALKELIDCELALGQYDEAVPELEKLVRQYPLREQLWAQLMRALYSSGRQADALSVYQEARRTLVEELGIEPGRELQDLERSILTHDRSLQVPARATPTTRFPSIPRRGRRRRAAIGLLAPLVLLLAFAMSRRDGPSDQLAPNSVGFIDTRSGHITRSDPVGREPRALALTEDSVWVANYHDGTVTRLPRGTGRGGTIPVGGHPTDLVAYRGSIWVWTLEGLLVAIDPRFESVGAPMRLAPPAPNGQVLGGIAAGGGFLWVTAPPTTVIRIEPKNARRHRAVVPDAGTGGPIGYHDGAAWVAGLDEVFPIAADTNTPVSGVRVGRVRDLAFDGNSLWIVSGGPNQVGGVVQALRRLDLRGRLVQTTIPVGGSPNAVTVADGSIWTASGSDGRIDRVDPARNRVVDTIKVGASPTALAADDRGIWVAVE
ncbi:MAG TPA: BTAD domain-containing putative transcriptional regulator [Solirubrobacter sp.]|nr:BTAD domain-containing putative transcriptional regulator [Solirubrobacter sp.]